MQVMTPFNAFQWTVVYKVRFFVSTCLRLDSVLQNVAWICLLWSVDAAKYSCCNSEYLSTLSPIPTSRYLRSCKLSSLLNKWTSTSETRNLIPGPEFASRDPLCAFAKFDIGNEKYFNNLTIFHQMASSAKKRSKLLKWDSFIRYVKPLDGYIKLRGT